MKISEVETEALTRALNDPNLQESIAQFLGLLKRFDKTEEEKYLEMMIDVALDVCEALPYNEVNVDGEWTTSPTMVCMITGYLMIDFGILPRFT